MLNVRDASEIAMRSLQPETIEILESFVAGINAFLSTDPELSLGFQVFGIKPEPYTVRDIVAMVKLISLYLSANYGDELLRYSFLLDYNLTTDRIDQIWPSYPSDGPTIVPEVQKRSFNFEKRMHEEKKIREKVCKKSKKGKGVQEDKLFQDLFWRDLEEKRFLGSNNWVMNGSFTQTGKPIMANDPHMGCTLPSLWLMMSLKSPNFTLAGISLAGSPGIAFGRNERISWAITSAVIDSQDTYNLETSNICFIFLTFLF